MVITKSLIELLGEERMETSIFFEETIIPISRSEM